MSLSSLAHPRRSGAWLLGAAVLLAGCGGDGPGGASTLTGYDGVLAALDGSETGTVEFNLSNSGSGSTGSFNLGGVATAFGAVAFDGGTVSASGGGFTFTGTLSNGSIDGSYTSPVGSGIFSTLEEQEGASPVLYCGTHSGTDGEVDFGGAFNFVLIGQAIRGVFATVDRPSLQGILTGTLGDNNAQVVGIPGDVTVLIDQGFFAGVYGFDGGESGGLQGGPCPTTPPEVIESLFGAFGATAGGGQNGAINLNISSQGNHSGSFNIDGANQIFDAITRDGDRIEASGGGFTFTGTLATGFLDGTFTGPNQAVGLFSSLLHPKDGSSVTIYCGDHQGSSPTGGSVAGLVNFVTIGNALRGIFLTLQGNGPTGVVSGAPGDNNAQLAGEPGDLTFLLNSQGFSGLYGFDSGIGGGLQGSLCP